MQVSDEEVKAAWLQAQNEVFTRTCAVWDRMQPFESRIRRRWWHQNPLQAPQVAAWWQYLDAVAADNDETALYALHERCLVPCASIPGASATHSAYLGCAATGAAALDCAVMFSFKVFE